MKLFEPAQAAGEATHGLVKAANPLDWLHKTLPLRAADVQIYLLCDRLTEVLIYLMVLFSPWAFGTSQPWSIWVMNTAGYVLGVMLAVRLAIRKLKGYGPPRWDVLSPESRVLSPESRVHGPQSTVHRLKSEGRGPKAEERSPESTAHSPQPAVHGLQSTVHSRRSGVATDRSVVSGLWSAVRGQRLLTARRLTTTLAVLTVAILGYCLVSALNARANYQPGTESFAYHKHYLRWLPHSLDSSRTWFAFWSYLGLACSFWAVRDWLLGKSFAEALPVRPGNGASGRGQAAFFPARLRRLFWVLAINGGLLGLEGIIQRLEGSGKLLFLVRPSIHKTAATQFGPYAYYANASQYFNLLWPACLGFWWMLHRSRGSRGWGHHVILLCCAIMAACPIISSSRGGAIITVGMLVLAALFLAATHLLLGGHRTHSRNCGIVAADVQSAHFHSESRSAPTARRRLRFSNAPSPSNENRRTRMTTFAALSLFFAGSLALGFALGWKALEPRLALLHEGYMSREQDYDRARPMAAEYPVFGTGPGTFESVSQLYRVYTEENWFAQLHNDWLETRITFGWVGSALIALAFIAVVLRWFAGGGIHGGRRFVMLIWLALAGCLVHARFDFPFQVHSIVFLFLVLCAVLFNLSKS